MNVGHSGRKFRINPVEIAVFSVVSLIFVNSVYRLFYDWGGFSQKNIGPEVALREEHRGIASIPQGGSSGSSGSTVGGSATGVSGFENIEIKCDPQLTRQTPAQKIRLNGAVCGLGNKGESGKPLKTEITNQTNKVSATVFMDGSNNTFLTDYLPLNPGQNIIELKFIYSGGKVVLNQLSVQRN